MQAWQATVQDAQGDVIPFPIVTVYEADGVTEAAIFDADGVALVNPITGNIDGFVQFFAEPGRYKVQADGGEAWDVLMSSQPPGVWEYDTLADAVADNAGGSVRVDYDAQTLPADYSGVMLEYTKRSQGRSFTQNQMLNAYALRTMRGQHELDHPTYRVSTFSIETNARGSLAKGPAAADYGQSINIAKRGFASGAAQPGEIDGLTISVRQDGVYGQPPSSNSASDASGILINAANVADCGFVTAIEAVTENIQATAPFAAQYSIQTQVGTMAMNQPGGPITYGYVAVANTGANSHAFYAGAGGSASWQNVLLAINRMRITWDGGYDVLTTAWPEGALKLVRDRAQNGASEIRHRGTGALLINTQEAAPIQFATSGTLRWSVQTNGSIVPAAGQTALNIGSPTNRWAATYVQTLDVSAGIVTMSSLPSYNDNAAALAGGLTAGRVYRTSTGELRVVI